MHGSLPPAALAASWHPCFICIVCSPARKVALTHACSPLCACRCDGTGPGDAPPDEQAAALLTAGELAAFLAGARGICLLQLLKGWGDTSDGRQQPLLRPWVLTLLQEAAGHKGVALLQSAAPGEAAQLGASLVLAARQQPWQAWARHLAGLGVQSSIVADSPFYKLLIGGLFSLFFPAISIHCGGLGCGHPGRAPAAHSGWCSSCGPASPLG